MNAVHVLKNPTGSARDFVKENNKDALNFNLEVAEKNDGSQMYFEIRDMVYEKLSSKIKEIIKMCETIGATLDKVTIGGVSYTVIITYYFWEVLNEFFVMNTSD